MIREHKIENKDWNLIVDCPFNGNKTNFSESGIVLSGTGSFVTDPVTGTNQVARFTSSSHTFSISLSDFSLNDIGNCKIDLDFLFYSKNSPSYQNIIDNSSSGNGGLFTQIEGELRLGITLGGYNKPQTPSFSSQVLKIDLSQIQINTWYHLLMERYKDIEHIKLNRDNDIIGELYLSNMPEYDYYSYGHDNPGTSLAIGGSYKWTSRYMNGCIKNLKIYKHL